MFRKLQIGAIGILLFWAMWIAGCRPENNNAGSIAAADTIPVTGDWIRIAHTADPDGLHPYNSRNALAAFIKENIFMYLEDYNSKTLLPEPTLAKSEPEISADGLNFTYEIRPEARWDNGDPVTGNDFAFSLKCVKNEFTENAQQKNYYSFIEDVKIDASNERRFTVFTNAPFFLAKTGIGGIEVISQKFYDSLDAMGKYSVADFQTKAALIAKDPDVVKFTDNFNSDKYVLSPAFIYGCGPYKLESWTTGDNVTLVRKKDWWGDKLRGKSFFFQGYADKLIFKTVKDKSTLPSIAKNGELDVTRDLNPDDFIAARADTSGYLYKHFNFYTPPSYGVSFLGFNCKPSLGRRPVVADVRVRQAIAHLTDVDSIIANIYHGLGRKQIGPISPLRSEEYDSTLKGYEFNPAKAKALLDEAGWIDSDGDGVRDMVIKGKKVKLEIEAIVSNSGETGGRMLRIIADQAQKIGMVINVSRIDFTKLTTRLVAHDFDIVGLGNAASPLPTDLKQLWSTENWGNNGSNYYGFGNATTDSLIEQIRQTPFAKDRTPLYHRFQALWLEQLPVLPILSPMERILIEKRFHNADPTSLRPGYKVYQFWTPKAAQKF